MSQQLPPGLLVSWYGDDFTGAAAVMEVLTFSGLPSVLFLDIPTPQLLADFSGYRGVGIAGVARAKSPDWMDKELPPIFDALAVMGAPIAHYKICSTLNSSPDIGSIGRAIELAIQPLGGAWHPLVVAVPAIGRFQAFGNLFAAFSGVNHRLDRHPTMSRHPVTPMGEADVRRHLAQQSKRPIGLIDLVALRSMQPDTALSAARATGEDIIAFDLIDENDLAQVGRIIWNNRGRRILAIGSQGLEYALVAYWRSAGLLDIQPDSPPIDPVARVVVVSGSCAPQTAVQIAFAVERGFEPIRIDVAKAVDHNAWVAEIERGVGLALAALSEGRDPIVFTAMGPEDPAVSAYRGALAVAGAEPMKVSERISAGLGKLLDRLVNTAQVRRGIIAGGDTSSGAAKALGISALTALAPTIPGAALFRAHSNDPGKDGLEIALKGGQMGAPNYFLQIKDGQSVT